MKRALVLSFTVACLTVSCGETQPAPPPNTAWFNFNSWPSSVVYVNGRVRGNTPLWHIRVDARRHQIRFVNPKLGMSKDVSVTVEAGVTRSVLVPLQQ